MSASSPEITLSDIAAEILHRAVFDSGVLELSDAGALPLASKDVKSQVFVDSDAIHGDDSLDPRYFFELKSIQPAIEDLVQVGDTKLRASGRQEDVSRVCDFLGVSESRFQSLLGVAIGSGKNELAFKRLAFVGDVALKLVASLQLFAITHPVLDTGVMTELKKSAESRLACAAFMEATKLDQYVASGSGSNDLLAEAFEAILGAVYLVGGLDQVKRVWMEFVSYRFRK